MATNYNNMKKYLYSLFLASVLLLPGFLFGAPNDVRITKTNSAGTANEVVILADPGADRVIRYNNTSNTLDYVAAGAGTVTTVSVTTANGVSGSVATDTTTPAISLTLGAITPSSVASTGAVSGTTGTFTSTTSLLLGTAGSAVGSIGFRNATSGTATVAPPTGALGTYTVTLPNAASTLPIFGQQLTFTGPSTARTVTLPDANFTVARTDAANTFTGVQAMTSPAVTTSLTTPSTTFALVNSTATTVNAFGATTALNIGASADMVLNFGGSANAAQFRFLEPVAGGSAYTGFRAQSQSANITYTLPAAVGAAGEVLSDPAGDGTLEWVAAGAGTINSGATNTIPKYTAATTIDDSLLTDDGTTLVYAGTGGISVGAASTVAGAIDMDEGTAQSLVANHFLIYAPTDVAAGGLAYVLPAAASSGVVQVTNTAGVMAISHSALTSGRVAFATTNGLLVDDSDMTFATDTLTTTSQVVSTNFDLGTAGVRFTNDADGAFTMLGLGNGTDENLTLNFDDTANTVVVSTSTAVDKLDLSAIGIFTTGNNSIGPLMDVDGVTNLNAQTEAFGAGTAYAFTNSAAAIDFGTTDPSITIAKAGTYTIYAQVHLAYAAATVVAETATITVRRTNDTAADLGQSVVIDLPASTVLTNSYGTVTLPPFSYTTAATTNILTINASVSATLGAGTINATAVGTSIIAIRRY